MIARLTLSPIDNDGSIGEHIADIEVEFSFDDANAAAQDLGLTLMETILPRMRDHEEGTSWPAFDATIETREKW